jgi:hypothetical protein
VSIGIKGGLSGLFLQEKLVALDAKTIRKKSSFFISILLVAEKYYLCVQFSTFGGLLSAYIEFEK